MAEYQNYYDYNYHTDAKEDAAEVKKLRESLRKSFPPSIRKQIEQRTGENSILVYRIIERQELGIRR